MRRPRFVQSLVGGVDRFTVFQGLLHAVAIAGLTLALLVTPFVETYFTRGVAASRSYQPISYTDINPMGINTFLNEEPDPAIVRRSLDMIASGGFGYVRQVFGWYEIEPQQDVFTYEDGRSSWEKYDRIVDLAHERGIEIIARLDKSPKWARINQPNPEIEGPPDDLNEYAEFVEQVVSRYRGKINFVQIWNEPNLEAEWGGGPIDPAEYVRLLEAGYRAAKRANPHVVVLLAGLAPTDQTGPHNLSDLLFLERVYELGGAPFFDVATCMVYGYGYSPFDRRVEWARNNFSRPIQTREIMERFGDEQTPLWGVEYGWVALPDDWQGRPSVWGEPVGEEQQAEYLVDGYLRAQREWPWMGMMAVWTFRFPRGPDHPDEIENPTRGFAIVEHDFTPRPAYLALKQQAPLIHHLGTGAYELSPEMRRRLHDGEPVQLRFLGERLDLAVRGSGGVEVTVDGETRDAIVVEAAKLSDGLDMYSSNDVPRLVTIADGLTDGPHRVTLQLTNVEDGGNDLRPEGVVVSRLSIHTWIYPWITAAVVVALTLSIASAVWMVWDRLPRPARATSDERAARDAKRAASS